MIPPIETYVVVSMAFAVFAAVTSVGAAIVLGVGYERLRAGLERVKEGLDVLNRQTGFFSTAIFKLEKRVDEIDPAQPRMIMEDEPVQAKTARKAKTTSRGKGKKAKTHLDDLPATTLTGVEKDSNSGGITITVPVTTANDWQSYQGLSKDEALANFASCKAEGKVRFM